MSTAKRAKALEFKHVLPPEVRTSDLLEAGPPADTRRVQWERERRELYVAMTRARGGLWVGVV